MPPQIISHNMYDKQEASEAWRSIMLPHEILVKSVHKFSMVKNSNEAKDETKKQAQEKAGN